jgi:hypothetical protein
MQSNEMSDTASASAEIAPDDCVNPSTASDVASSAKHSILLTRTHPSNSPGSALDPQLYTFGTTKSRFHSVYRASSTLVWQSIFCETTLVFHFHPNRATLIGERTYDEALHAFILESMASVDVEFTGDKSVFQRFVGVIAEQFQSHFGRLNNMSNEECDFLTEFLEISDERRHELSSTFLGSLNVGNPTNRAPSTYLFSSTGQAETLSIRLVSSVCNCQIYCHR